MTPRRIASGLEAVAQPLGRRAHGHLATFMEVLDSSIANVSLPHIAGSLGATYDEAIWVLTSYLVSAAIVLPVSGWLSTVFGRKRFYMTCVALFTVSSFLCGIAPNLPLLIVARMLQGAGGGGLQPSEQAILADTFPVAKRGHGFRGLWHGRGGWRPPSVPRWAAGSPTTSTGTGSSSSTCRSALLSLFFTSRLVEDPPWLKEEKRAGIKIDYIGLSLLVTGRRLLPVRARQRPGIGLVLFAPDHRAVLRRHSDAGRVLPLGVVSPESHCRRAPAQEPQLRHRRVLLVRPGDGLVRIHGFDSRVSAKQPGLHRRAGRAGALTRRALC